MPHASKPLGYYRLTEQASRRPTAVPMPAWACENWKDPDLIVDFPPLDQEAWPVDAVCEFVRTWRSIVRQAEVEEARAARGKAPVRSPQAPGSISRGRLV